MDKHKHEYLSKFSKGMKQKTMLIVAFLTEPDFYIIDEPFIGLRSGSYERVFKLFI